jgi:hypothetical protein
VERISNSNLVSRLRNWWTSCGQPPVLFPIVWLIFYVPRVWRFGVYYGDWSDLMLINPFDSIWWLFNSRPVALLVSYVLPRLIGNHPAIWQALLCASMLCAAVLFYKVLIRVGLLLERPAEAPIGSYRVSADVVVACWLLFPWTLGWTAWPTLMMGQLALLFFLLSMQLLLTAEGKGQVVAAALAYALCNFAYEPFYLAFLPFLAILFISDERRHFWLKVVLLFSVQVIAIGYNRLMAHIMVNGGAAKTFNYSAFAKLPGTVWHLFGQLLSTVPQTPRQMIWIASAAATVMLGLILKSRSQVAQRYAVVLIASLVMIAISVLQFGLAGYGMSGNGEAGRTTIAVSIWLAVLVLVFLRTCWTSTLPFVRGVSIVVMVALLIGYGAGLYHQNELWAFAWRESVRTAESAPAAEIAKLPPNALIVYVGPSDIEVINYVHRLPLWVALPTYHPETALPPEMGSSPGIGEFGPITTRLVGSPDKSVAIRPVVVKTSYMTLSWDGRELVLTSPGNWTETFLTSLVYEWDAYRGTFRRMEPNTPFGTPLQ